MGHNRNLADYAHHFDGTHIDLGSGNIETQGVLTYEDVTNVDAIGIVTARAGVKVPDNQKIILGNDSDLQIYHDGANSHVSDQGTGDLRLSGNVVKFNNQSNTATMVMATQGGSVVLNHDGSTKFETTATGATVTGTLVSDGVTSELDLSAISSSISSTAVDVFVYDTRKDSDGGAWRKRTQHTSWYNETLNTSTRGSRKEFPAVAVIVTTATNVTIYDGDDPDLPMWMDFQSGSYYFIGPGNRVKNSAHMLNGILCVTKSGSISWMSYISFVDDKARQYSDNDGEKRDYLVPISYRNASNANAVVNSIQKYTIVNDATNDVAMTVLPNAPVDSATGLPIPTIAVATAGGVSVIKDDETVVDLNVVNRPYSSVYFSDDHLVWAVENPGGVNYDLLRYFEIPAADITTSSSYGPASTPALFPTNTKGNIFNSYAYGSPVGLTIIDHTDGAGTVANSRVAYATNSYNTGWLHGDIKGAFLSDTDDTDAVVAYSDGFSNNDKGWGFVDASISGGNLVITQQGSARATDGDALSHVSTGVKLVFTFTVSGSGTGDVLLDDDGAGAGVGGNTNYASFSSTGSYTVTATKTASPRLRFIRQNGSNDYNINFLNITTEYDRSVNNKGLSVYGTVTKSAVATGAELVSYSNFSASNHLRQPPNSDMNIGTGDAYEMIWFKTTNASGTMMMMSYEGGAIGTNDYGKPFNIRYENGSVRGWASHNGFSTWDDVNHGVSTANGQWHCAAWVKRGQVFELYVDGEFIGSDTGSVGSNALSDANSELVIGARKRGKAPGDSEEPWNNGSLALARIGKSAPSAEKIKKMYEDEKVLFQENAKATLYGSSDAVTALAYDEDTELLHVGTSAGRSDFQGLRRINNTTTAVTTAISASDDLIAEQ